MTKITRGNKDEKYNSIFAVRLRLLFEENPNVSQCQLSEVLGRSRQTVSQYVNGISEPSYDTLVKIADYFDVSIDYLLGRTETRSVDLSIKDVCAMTGLNEHSIEALQSIHACSKTDVDDAKQLLERNPDYALCAVNEFIDFALAPKENRFLPAEHYISYRKAVEQCQKDGGRWDQLSSEEQAGIIAKLSSTGMVYIPAKRAATFYRDLFCDNYSDYLRSKYPTKEIVPPANGKVKSSLSDYVKQAPSKPVSQEEYDTMRADRNSWKDAFGESNEKVAEEVKRREAVEHENARLKKIIIQHLLGDAVCAHCKHFAQCKREAVEENDAALQNESTFWNCDGYSHFIPRKEG